MSDPQPTRPDPTVTHREPWATALFPIAIGLAAGLFAFVMAVRL